MVLQETSDTGLLTNHQLRASERVHSPGKSANVHSGHLRTDFISGALASLLFFPSSSVFLHLALALAIVFCTFPSLHTCRNLGGETKKIRDDLR